jgi:hypothetical protein
MICRRSLFSLKLEIEEFTYPGEAQDTPRKQETQEKNKGDTIAPLDK